jgi:hypothetical protein
MRKRPKRPLPASLPGPCHAVLWAEPTAGPSALGLVVAALIGATAAGSWSLSAWIAAGPVAGPPGAVEAEVASPGLSSVARTGVRPVPDTTIDGGG